MTGYESKHRELELRDIARWFSHRAASESEPETKQSHTNDALVCSTAADEIERLRDALNRAAEATEIDRGAGWLRTAGWSSDLHCFDVSERDDGTFALTIQERGGNLLVDIDRLTRKDLAEFRDLIGSAIDITVATGAAELRTITSAPKDGSRILLHRERDALYIVGHWDDGRSCWIDSELIAPVVNPTHWAPLPSAPATEAQFGADRARG